MAERAKAKKKAAAKNAPKGARGSRGKVAKADNPRATIGSNSARASDALIKSHHEKLDAIEGRMSKAKTAYDKIKGEHRAAYAVVKQDGIDVDSLKLARKLHAEDHGIVVTTYANVGAYLSAIKSELATQMDLFQDMAPPPAGDATLAGAAAFKNKEDRQNNPHKAGTELYVNWDSGWLAESQKADLSDGDGRTIN